MVESFDVLLSTALGALAAVFFFLFRQLSEVRRQLSALRVQIGALRLAAASKPNGKPPEAGPPEGARRKGNLWVVPLFLGLLAGFGRWLRRMVTDHPAPVAAATAVTAAVGGALYLGGAFSPHHSDAGPVPRPPAVSHPPVGHAPGPTPTAAPGSHRPAMPSGAASAHTPTVVTVTDRHAPGPTAAPSGPLTAAPAAPTAAPGTSQPPPIPGPSTPPTAAPAPSAAPAAPPPAVAPTPTPAPTSSGLCLRVVVDPVTGVVVCVG